jgi:hypothetical protein
MILQPATPKSGEDPGGAPGALPPKIGKDMIFLRKMVYSYLTWRNTPLPGADLGFQVRGGRTLKNCAERREARKFLGYFV